jgi:PII-like signaling protein
MEGCFLRFYLDEGQRCHGRLAWQWLLDEANKLGIRGGTAFHAMAGFGHHHHMQEDHFFELAGNLPVEVEFVVTEKESEALLEILHREKLRVFYAHIPARMGVVNPESDDPPENGQTKQ